MQNIHLMPFGAEITKNGVRFALWAPSAKQVDLVCDARRVELPSVGQGWFKLIDAAAKAGDLYAFAINGTKDLVPDPASRFQIDDRDRRSSVLDPSAFAWSDGSWRGRDWDEVVLCEVHLGTATPEGTYAALEARLPFYKDVGITAIELMPLAETSGLRTWGYDGVLPFAPNNAYGTPDELKSLVAAAHRLGLMVFLDVVYNHFGPTGNFLHAYAESFFTDRHSTPWGAAINFDGQSGDSEVVREFFIHNALYWIEEYHLDGLRFDAVHAIIDEGDRHFLDELAERIRETFPDRRVHLVLENEKNEAHRLIRDSEGLPLSFDAQWDDDYHHCWHVLLTGEDEGYYGDFGGDTVARLGRALAEGFVYQGERSPNLGHARGESTQGLPPQAFVAFLQNHDQIGNRAQGERLTSLADPARLRLARAALYLGPLIPMIFMGDEWGTRTPFQFFVNFEHEPELETAVRKGRAKEFESFKAFAGDDPSLAIPDPTAQQTFLSSKLDWSEIERPMHADVLTETRDLLALRQREIVPLLKSGFVTSVFEQPQADALIVRWTFEGGALAFVANFGAEPWQPTLPDEALILWKSEGLPDVLPFVLARWTGLIYKTRA